MIIKLQTPIGRPVVCSKAEYCIRKKPPTFEWYYFYVILLILHPILHSSSLYCTATNNVFSSQSITQVRNSTHGFPPPLTRAYRSKTAGPLIIHVSLIFSQSPPRPPSLASTAALNTFPSPPARSTVQRCSLLTLFNYQTPKALLLPYEDEDPGHDLGDE